MVAFFKSFLKNFYFQSQLCDLKDNGVPIEGGFIVLEREKRLYMYEVVAHHLESGVHVIDSTGRTVIYNSKMREIEGMEVEDVLDKNLLDVFQFHSEEESTLLQVLHTGTPTLNVKQTYFNSNGVEITTINDTYPIHLEGEIIGAVEIARDVTTLEKMMKGYVHTRPVPPAFHRIVGSHPRIQEALSAGKKAALSTTPILICGEIGTGKEMLARSIHCDGIRKDAPFIKQDCSSMPGEDLSMILFGTGFKDGVMKEAAGGSILFDELNAMPIHVQEQLLDLMDRSSIPDVRLMATVNEDPIDAVAEGRLLKELYYRFSSASFFIPPLRNRLDDLQELVPSFLDRFNHHYARNVTGISKEVEETFRQYDWPGNVRELEHVLEGAYQLIGSHKVIGFNHLPFGFRQRIHHSPVADIHQGDSDFLHQSGSEPKPLEVFMEEAETYYIQKAMKHHQFNVTKTAKALGMSRQNLQYRIRKYGIERGGY
ncbi:PAS domain-containing protein [Rossellomorea marisflavi]|uniref:PAS domain-containing protein n=1 Tax=Rossellomorea marisflavi TaxID=189381 RepID=A0A5D4RP25_9BACI|nr:PAS domain-containing protein [Rossellomorea marisflavi]